MKKSISIDQAKALAWGLNLPQAMVLSLLLSSSYDQRTQTTVNGKVLFQFSKHEIVEQLPLVAHKPDSAYRLLKQLASKGLVDMYADDTGSYLRLSALAETWRGVAV